jgi:Family of unknown function (DUF5335)
MREVRSNDWDAFCGRLNQFERGATVTIEFLDRNGRMTEIARTVPFEEIQFGKRDACNDRISIRGRDKADTNHEIVEPIHILLRETEGGAGFNAVAIEAEEGTTFLMFQPVIRAQWLDGLTLA